MKSKLEDLTAEDKIKLYEQTIETIEGSFGIVFLCFVFAGKLGLNVNEVYPAELAKYFPELYKLRNITHPKAQVLFNDNAARIQALKQAIVILKT